ncbi:unnamed protein product [Ambrosiozyma monospora]|uniref:Unnamed protein product n=1 Tax=Ambrosiozyma monospora TaxID=43982 RepID=A0ACB5U1J9_AMBMO|nr:unnamed protein product [Ambrosiozyma monospora]
MIDADVDADKSKKTESDTQLPFEFEVSVQIIDRPHRFLTFESRNTLTNALTGDKSTKQLESQVSNKRRKIYHEHSNLLNFFTNPSESVKKTIKKNLEKSKPSSEKDKVSKLADDVSKVKISKPAAATAKKPAVVSKPKQKINLDVELKKKNEKPNLSFVVIGHVDSGKSTMTGRLLYDLNIVDSKTLHKLTKESESIGKASFSLAWIMDQTKEERNRGITVDICQTQFETKQSSFTIIDSPGHKDYVPQMINGVTQADLAIAIIDASSFESGFIADGQTKEHLTIAKSLGIEKCILLINKMDVVGWSQDRYEEIKDQLTEFLTDELKYVI